MENKHAALIAAAVIIAEQGLYSGSFDTATKLAERFESWLDNRP